MKSKKVKQPIPLEEQSVTEQLCTPLEDEPYIECSICGFKIRDDINVLGAAYLHNLIHHDENAFGDAFNFKLWGVSS